MGKELLKGIENLFALKGQCYGQVLEDLHLTELSFKQLRYIKKLNTDKGITVSEIAESFDLSKPTVTEMIKKFVKADLVYKQTCTQDGRVHYIKLTEKGLAIASLEGKTLAYVEKLLIERLDDTDIAALVEILNKL